MNIKIARSNYLSGSLFIILLTTFGLASCGASGGSSTTIIQGVATGPDLSLSATPLVLANNSNSVITWASANATSCNLSGLLTGGSGNTTGISGSYSTPILNSPTTYTVNCIFSTGNSASKSVTIIVNPAIATVQAAAIAEPVRGPVTHFCDCGQGASPNCAGHQGNDSTGDGSASAPYQTFAKLVSVVNATTTGPATFAICQGGALTETAPVGFGNSSCSAGANGTLNTCFDIREYAPSSFAGGGAKPIINGYTGSSNPIIFHMIGAVGGYRIMNLRLQGSGNAGSFAFQLYSGPHDIEFLNNDIDSFSKGGNFGTTPSASMPLTNLVASGNNFTNNLLVGFLGSGNYSSISNNLFENNGGDAALDHNMYISTGGLNTTNVSVLGNYLTGTIGSVRCIGVQLVVHGTLDYFTVSGNDIEVDPSIFGQGCYGIGLGPASGDLYGLYYRHTTVTDNIVHNGGSIPIAISLCPYCVVTNNLVINDAPLAANGIEIPASAARTTGTYNDDTTHDAIVANNTIYFSSGASTGSSSCCSGITSQINEGTGYIYSNNAIYMATNTGSVINKCFYNNLPSTSIAYQNYNSCYSASAYDWAYYVTTPTSYTLSGWQGLGFDGNSLTTNPNFTSITSPYNFVPQTGSSLIAAGIATYAPTTDITGITRPNPPAIGAYEP